MDEPQLPGRTLWVVSDEGGQPFQVFLGESDELPKSLHPIFGLEDLRGFGLNPEGWYQVPEGATGGSKEVVK